ncbi:acVLRF1 family peptidyl-tRNA hydrolase [Janibacter sp. GXQ6167]|uniref:acVLRF1 family peptidyl-tRNA hydrolase n=1 Tax=Janibacter sp. GXQ6167 TaxID=3240791 RepID=UPI00352502A4
MSGPRRVEVEPARLPRWLDGVRERHGDLAWTGGPHDPSFEIVAADGTHIVGERFDHDPLGLLLVRRGGWAVGRAEGGALPAHTTGTKYVQSRTAAGGWSQQRFARRRANQADALVLALVEPAIRHLSDAPLGALVVGGDKALVASLLTVFADEARLRPLLALPRRELYDLPDPRLKVLQDAAHRGRAVRLAITDP